MALGLGFKKGFVPRLSGLNSGLGHWGTKCRSMKELFGTGFHSDIP